MTEPTFKKNQRVRILPCKNYPPTKTSGGIRYGIVQGMTDHPEMHFVNEDRSNNAGEWAYIVSSYRNPRAGAMWFSSKGLQPMKKDKTP